ncbi:SURF1 family protein [Pontibaca salina]|uniref:SURF1-like protein n=1 Tax=Pontibaca salina TaxID=2795731 RepID=A0A934LXR9_9RHOB|nr:SURF1 family protein [Pontibaca salina]MBI6628947.1 SURF1 family protein [Pontibaca salina]
MRRILFLLVFGIAGTATLIGLGVWQMNRLAWKHSVLTEIDRRIAADPVTLPVNPDPEADKYMPVQVTGRVGSEELHVLVSIKHVGPGYRLIAPFVTDEGRRILLDRGFVPSDEKDAPRNHGAMTVTGNLHWPQESDSYTPETEFDTNIWYARDVPAMAAALETEPVMLVARNSTGPAVTALPVDTRGIPNDHLQYAITWFSLALIWVAMTASFLWRTRARKTG